MDSDLIIQIKNVSYAYLDDGDPTTEEKLALDNVLQTADRFAKLSVWEIYSPIIKSVAKDYTLEVVFR